MGLDPVASMLGLVDGFGLNPADDRELDRVDDLGMDQ